MMKEKDVDHAAQNIKMPLGRVTMTPYIPPAGRGHLPEVPNVSTAPKEKG